MYAKLINDLLEPAPQTVIKNNLVVQNYHLDSNAEMLATDGYKLFEDPGIPTDIIRPKKSYLETEDKIIAVYKETYTEPDYREKRAGAYPDFREYLDAVVKANSGDKTLAAEGTEQMNTYIQRCLEVKNLYPKP